MSQRLKKRIFAILAKIAVVCLVFNLPLIPLTNASFSDQESVSGNQVSAGYWEAPTLVYPLNGTIVTLGSAWDLNPYMDWDYSLHGPGVQYVYESSHNNIINPDGSFTSPVYISGLLSNTQIPAPGTPDGIYYWHVRALISGTWTPWSEIWLLTVDRSQPAPSPTPAPVVINEVYYDVAPDKGDEGNESNPDEWVELYNNTDQPVNLKDWSLTDNSGSDIISHANTYIPANGFAVLAKSASTWAYWSIPSSAEKISLGQKIGNGLGNDGDRLILKDDNGVEIDAVSWGSNTYAFSPSVGDVAEGHSIARSPKGHDTNTSADWVDLATPNPGTNPHPPVTELIAPLPNFESLIESSPSATPEASPTATPSVQPSPIPESSPESSPSGTSQDNTTPTPPITDLNLSPTPTPEGTPEENLVPSPTPTPEEQPPNSDPPITSPSNPESKPEDTVGVNE